MAPVRSEAQENNKEIPKLLCQMDNHLGLLLACLKCTQMHPILLFYSYLLPHNKANREQLIHRD